VSQGKKEFQTKKDLGRTMKETAIEVDKWPSWLRSQEYERTTREIREKITKKASEK